MSDGEVGILIFTLSLSVISWIYWYYISLSVLKLGSNFKVRLPLIISPIISFLFIYSVLKNLSSFDVKDDPKYIFFYLVIGVFWISIFIKFLPLIGFSYWYDAIERNNIAVSIVVAGATIAAGLCYAGGNIGSGPGWWVVIFCAFLSSGALFLMLLLLSFFTDLIELLTIERDTATGLRLGFLIVSAGLILGRAVAGDWNTAARTVTDFSIISWVLIFYFAAEFIILEYLSYFTKKPKLPFFIYGILPSILYLISSIVYVISLGPWNTAIYR